MAAKLVDDWVDWMAEKLVDDSVVCLVGLLANLMAGTLDLARVCGGSKGPTVWR